MPEKKTILKWFIIGGIKYKSETYGNERNKQERYNQVALHVGKQIGLSQTLLS
jgi:hypothetical protein